MANILTALDMHIEVLQGLQKVDSFQQDMFLPEEIDLHLNKQQDRFIESMFNNNFQDQQIRLDYIKSLVVKDKKLILFKNQELLDMEARQVGYAPLPGNYLHMVSDRSRLAYLPKDCDNILDKISYVDYQNSFAVLPLPEPGLTNPYYQDFKIVIKGITVYESKLDITDPDYISVLVKDVLDNIDLSKFSMLSKENIYWENYQDSYFPRSFIFARALEDDTPVNAIGFPHSFKILTATNSITGNIITNTVQAVNRTLPFKDTKQAFTRELVENKLSENSEIYEFNKNVFYKSNRREPHSLIANGNIYVHGGDSFIITDLVIDYVRKPRQISLALNQSCELSGTAPRLIIDATVEYLKLIIENPSYSAVLQDNQIRNQNTITNG